MQTQTQPVIPVTMQYGDSYGRNGHHDNHHEYHHIEREVHRSGDQTKRDVNDNGTRIIASLERQANADQAQTRASQIETKQALERNADYTNNSIERTSTQGLLATQNTSTAGLLATQNTATAGLLATQNTATATQLAVQNTATAGLTAVTNAYNQLSALASVNQSATVQGQNALSVQSEKNAAATQLSVVTQAQSILLGQKDREVKASDQHGSAKLQASEYKASSDLQAANYKAHLENLITKTAAEGLLKTCETSAKILEKIAECCCENKLAHNATQLLVIQNGTANQTAILNTMQSTTNSQLQQALAAANQETLFAKFAATQISKV